MSKEYANRLRDLRNDPQLIVFYAKENCKHCYGKGYQTFNHPVTGDKVVFCRCVEKNVRKETDELERVIAEAKSESAESHPEMERWGEDSAS